jgi:hypothetical protein
MAILYPDFEVIDKYKVQPTIGEKTLLNYLENKLDDSYEIFFQPYLNLDRPDIVLLRKDSGAIIIEVKDWHLKNYYIDQETNWRLKDNNAYIKSPLQQLSYYKENLYNLHLESLFNLFMKDKNSFGLIGCALYFHNESEFNLKNFHRDGIIPALHYKYLNSLNHFSFLGYDSLTPAGLKQLLNKSHLSKNSVYFTNDLYLSFKRYLKPPFHAIEDGTEIAYTNEQIELSRSEVRPRRKVKGIAGCGKSLVLAKRAVNAYRRTGKEVLILTYNISLINYMRDKLNEVRENFEWKYFDITNYHHFFSTMANNYGINVKNIWDYDNPKYFDKVSGSIDKYEVIFIDEIQDYKTEWLELIHNRFLVDNGEFCVFGDEKQNIYERKLDENKEPKTIGIPGTYNMSLNRTFRFTPDLVHLADIFQKHFFENIYNKDNINYSGQYAMNATSIIEYYYFNNFSEPIVLSKLYETLNKYGIHPSDSGILASKVETIRNLEYLIRTQMRENTKIMFETKEEYNVLEDKFTVNGKLDKSKLKMEVEKIRKNRKFHFYMKDGTMKLSTIHSFKGWEIHTLFLLIDSEDHDFDEWTTTELIYTAITRCRFNLFVFNLGDKKYDEFFKKNIEVKYIV